MGKGNSRAGTAGVQGSFPQETRLKILWVPLKSWSCHFRGKLQRDLEAVFQVVSSVCVSQRAQLGLLDKFLHFRGSTANLRTLENVAASFGACTEPNPPDPAGEVGQHNMLVPLFHFPGDSGGHETHKVQKASFPTSWGGI